MEAAATIAEGKIAIFAAVKEGFSFASNLFPPPAFITGRWGTGHLFFACRAVERASLARPWSAKRHGDRRSDLSLCSMSRLPYTSERSHTIGLFHLSPLCSPRRASASASLRRDESEARSTLTKPKKPFGIFGSDPGEIVHVHTALFCDRFRSESHESGFTTLPSVRNRR